MYIKNIVLLLFIILNVYNSFAQSKFVVVDSIIIEGCKKTKHDIVFRDLYIKIGDTILLEDIPKAIKTSEDHLGNTGIFRSNKLIISDWQENKITILCRIKEIGFSLPVPSVDLADRNFNVWWKDYNFSLRRVNFGLNFSTPNLSGKKDRLRTEVQFGFTRKLELDYLFPYLNKKKTIGFNANILWAKSKEINYQVKDNIELFYRDSDNFLLDRFRFFGRFIYQPGLFHSNSLSLGYFKNKIGNHVLEKLNPEFFSNRKNKEEYFELAYNWKYSKLDNIYSPYSGYRITLDLSKKGLGVFKDVNQLSLHSSAIKYTKLGLKQSFILELKGKYSFINDIPFFYENKSLGYEEDFIHGYESYVMNGFNFAMIGLGYKLKLFDKIVNWKKLMIFKAYRLMPISLGLRVYSEFGYVDDKYKNPSNNLVNDYLWGSGIGLDAIVLRKYLGQIQFSINRLGEKGIFLHYKLKFE